MSQAKKLIMNEVVYQQFLANFVRQKNRSRPILPIFSRDQSARTELVKGVIRPPELLSVMITTNHIPSNDEMCVLDRSVRWLVVVSVFPHTKRKTQQRLLFYLVPKQLFVYLYNTHSHKQHAHWKTSQEQCRSTQTRTHTSARVLQLSPDRFLRCRHCHPVGQVEHVCSVVWSQCRVHGHVLQVDICVL